MPTDHPENDSLTRDVAGLLQGLLDLPPHDPKRWQDTDGFTSPEDPTNADRAASVEPLVTLFSAEQYWGDIGTQDYHVQDMITHLLHYAHSQGWNLFDLLRYGVANFLAEAGPLPASEQSLNS